MLIHFLAEKGNPQFIHHASSCARDKHVGSLCVVTHIMTIITITDIKELNYPKVYFIHCDLIDKQKNLFNRNRSEVKGDCYERLTYEKLNNEFHDISAGGE